MLFSIFLKFFSNYKLFIFFFLFFVFFFFFFNLFKLFLIFFLSPHFKQVFSNYFVNLLGIRSRNLRCIDMTKFRKCGPRARKQIFFRKYRFFFFCKNFKKKGKKRKSEKKKKKKGKNSVKERR